MTICLAWIQRVATSFSVRQPNINSFESRLTLAYAGRTAMNDTNNNQPQHYEPSAMQTDTNDMNNILAQMPTPVSNNIRASSETNTFMSPLQVDQQGGYDRANGVQYPTQSSEDVWPVLLAATDMRKDVLYSPSFACCHSNGCHASL